MSEQLEDAGGQATGGREDTPRYPNISFGATVGEFSGEAQHPPESLRKGRRCYLTDYQIVDDSVYDEVALKWITYLEPRPAPEEWLEEQLVGKIMGHWRPYFKPVEMDASEWRDEVQAAFDNAIREIEAEG